MPTHPRSNWQLTIPCGLVRAGLVGSGRCRSIGLTRVYRMSCHMWFCDGSSYAAFHAQAKNRAKREKRAKHQQTAQQDDDEKEDEEDDEQERQHQDDEIEQPEEDQQDIEMEMEIEGLEQEVSGVMCIHGIFAFHDVTDVI